MWSEMGLARTWFWREIRTLVVLYTLRKSGDYKGEAPMES